MTSLHGLGFDPLKSSDFFGSPLSTSLGFARRNPIVWVNDAHPGANTDLITFFECPEAATPQPIIIDITKGIWRGRCGYR